MNINAKENVEMPFIMEIFFSTPQGSYRDGGSPSHSDLDATRADTLPGNTHNKKSCSPRHRGFNRSVKKGPTTSSPIEKQNRSDVFNTEVNNILIKKYQNKLIIHVFYYRS